METCLKQLGAPAAILSSSGEEMQLHNCNAMHNYIVSVTVENYCQLSFKPRQPGFMFDISAYFGIPSGEASNPCWISELPVKTSTTPQ